jgi:hypothetical protein
LLLITLLGLAMGWMLLRVARAPFKDGAPRAPTRTKSN